MDAVDEFSASLDYLVEHDGATAGVLPVPLDWEELFARDPSGRDWLVEDLWPTDRQLHIHAARKTGKSLVMLYIAASLAAGRDPFTRQRQPAIRVTYCDFEMTEDDLLERLTDMGFVPADLVELRYYLWPAIAPLDTPEGGRTMLETVQRDGARALVLDTVSRVVEGEENSADTYREFFRWTGMHLKAAGVALARLDHEGHKAGQSRGSSAKADDVDVVWQLTATEGGLRFTRKAARVSWVPEHVDLIRVDDPLGYRRALGSWPAGTAEKAAQLDRLAIPIDASKREARAAIVAAGEQPGRNDILMKALNWRRSHREGQL